LIFHQIAARMMEGHDLPSVIEDGRSARSGEGVGGVLKAMIE
jgi:hypothetical protein